jgi:hypothetical protein
MATPQLLRMIISAHRQHEDVTVILFNRRLIYRKYLYLNYPLEDNDDLKYLALQPEPARAMVRQALNIDGVMAADLYPCQLVITRCLAFLWDEIEPDVIRAIAAAFGQAPEVHYEKYGRGKVHPLLQALPDLSAAHVGGADMSAINAIQLSAAAFNFKLSC